MALGGLGRGRRVLCGILLAEERETYVTLDLMTFDTEKRAFNSSQIS